MKKIILSLLILVLLTGCVSIEHSSVDKLIKTTLNSKYSLCNHVNRGFKYYLPRDLTVTKTDEFNEIIKSKYYDYYLYVDLVKYFNKLEDKYRVDDTLFYSKKIKKDDKKGIVNIQSINDDEYLIKVYYNYARIEVKVKEKDINESVTNALVILSSMEYNDKVIENLLKDDKLNSIEEEIDVFDVDLTEDDYLDVEEEVYEDDGYDPDVIN